MKVSGKRLWWGDAADLVTDISTPATPLYQVDFKLDYRKYDILAGWDITNDASGSDPIVTIFTHNRVDFHQFLENPVLYEAGATTLACATAAAFGLMAVGY